MAEQQDEEPTLPTLPDYPSDMELDHQQVETFPSGKRKRSYQLHMFSDSSEPAIFSSDNDQAAENYIQGPRQKKQYRGAWDHQQPLDSLPGGSTSSQGPRASRRKLQPVDSGVFMGSSDSIDEALYFPPPPASRWQQLTTSTSHSPEARALLKIQQCVDEGDQRAQRVDLSDLGLEKISENVIRKLGDVLPIPHVLPGVSFTPQPEPNLKLFLANNRLTQCPKEIFDFTNLTVLSLRSNNLTEIPPAICQLTNLTELNVSMNDLKYLPVDLLELLCSPDCKLTTLVLHPNPFHLPLLVPNTVAEALTQDTPGWLPNPPPPNCHFGAQLIRRTPVHTRDGHQYVHRQRVWNLRLPIMSTKQAHLVTDDFRVKAVLPRHAKPTKVLSLMDICLQTISSKCPSNIDWLEQVQSLKTFKDDPASAEDSAHLRILEEMDAQRQGGTVLCTVCRRKVVRPVAQWIEWYDIFEGKAKVPQSALWQWEWVPFLRQACTWACVEDRTRGLGWQAEPLKAA